MKEIHNDKFKFMPYSCATAMETVLKSPCPTVGKGAAAEETDQVEKDPRVRLTDHTYG